MKEGWSWPVSGWPVNKARPSKREAADSSATDFNDLVIEPANKFIAGNSVGREKLEKAFWFYERFTKKKSAACQLFKHANNGELSRGRSGFCSLSRLFC